MLIIVFPYRIHQALLWYMQHHHQGERDGATMYGRAKKLSDRKRKLFHFFKL